MKLCPIENCEQCRFCKGGYPINPYCAHPKNRGGPADMYKIPKGCPLEDVPVNEGEKA